MRHRAGTVCWLLAALAALLWGACGEDSSGGGAAGAAAGPGSGTGGSGASAGSGGMGGASGGAAGVAGLGNAGAAGSAGTDGSASCPAGALLASLGKNRMLVGASMDDAMAAQAPFDVRYLYLAGGLFDGSSPCQSCRTGCTAKGSSCANSNPNGCAWWGCWQSDTDPPGGYARGFIQKAQSKGQIPMFTYYQILQASGVGEGQPEVTVAARDQQLMTRYLADWKFALQQVGQSVAFLHIEPDFWGYAQHEGNDPHQLAASVASAAPADCAGQENSIAGLGRCMIAMVRTYAPNAKVGLHASGWGTKIDVLNNKSASLDVVGEANKLGAFLVECGAAESDYVVVETSDRDAGYYESIGQNRWWDANNATLPNFHQAFAWTRALADNVGKPLIWWQMPIGNMSLAGGTDHWKDNRLDYFFAHMDEVASGGAFGVVYGAGAAGQTTPSTDSGNLIAKVKAYVASGGQKPCP